MQLLGATVDEKADIFSFGVLLWEICTKEVPERGCMRPLECVPFFERLPWHIMAEVCLGGFVGRLISTPLSTVRGQALLI